jgi:DNA-binding SARP family transcriptional activator
MMRFRLLGPLEVRAGEEAWRGIGAPKWRSVLAALLIHPGQIVSADTLLNEVWGDAPPAKAANLISIYVLRLRRLLHDEDEGLLVTRAPGYQLQVSASDTDALLFEVMVRDGRRAFDAGDPAGAASQLGEALALWHGAPLADVPPTPLVEAEAARLAELRLGAIELRIAAELACGAHDQAVAEIRRLLADHPLREGLWLLLMRALDGAGRHAEALEVYGQARDAISGQLGVDPGAELRQFHAELLAKDSAGLSGGIPANTAAIRPWKPELEVASPAPLQGSGGTGGSPGHGSRLPVQIPAQLPADIADFTGRDEQIKRLCELLSGTDAGRIAVVTGAGGLGKTSLAVHAAHRVRRKFPDGQLYVDLLGATPTPLPAGDVLARFLRDLGVDGRDIPVDEAERAARYRTTLAERRVLVVLDNARDAAQVRPLLPGTASSAVLVTTRSRMPDLASTALVDLNVLGDDEALKLFIKVVGEERAAAEPAATAELLDACAGLPLAIKICAARLVTRSGWTIRTVAARLRDQHRRLDEMRAGDLAVRASFQVSFASLPTSADKQGIDPARAFCLLGLWQGSSISSAAAAALFDVPRYSAEDALEVLVDTHLLESMGPGRYRFHDLLWVYAAERAADSLSAAERDAAISRLRDWRDSERADEVAETRQASASGLHESARASQAGFGSLPVAEDQHRVDMAVELRQLDADILVVGSANTTPGLTGPADSDSSPSRPPADELSIHNEQQKANSHEGPGRELVTGNDIRDTAAEEAATGPRLEEYPVSGDSTEDSQPPANEALLTVLRTILAAHGIVDREQVAACFDTLIRSWPETASPAAGLSAKSPGEIGSHPVPKPAKVILDTPGHDQRPDPLAAMTAKDFVKTLADLREWAGAPSFREMERRCGHEVAFATMCTALGSDKLPSLKVVLAIVAACVGGEEHEEQERAYTTAWRKLRRTQEPGRRQGKQSANRKLYPIPDTA